MKNERKVFEVTMIRLKRNNIGILPCNFRPICFTKRHTFNHIIFDIFLPYTRYMSYGHNKIKCVVQSQSCGQIGENAPNFDASVDSQRNNLTVNRRCLQFSH
jgi:hypothetical protein